MKQIKFILFLIVILLFTSNVYAQYMPSVIAEEADGTPSGAFYKIVLPNDTVSIINGVATYTDAGGAVEGTAVLSTGETGGTKFLREDGDGTSSWQIALTSEADPTVDTSAEIVAIIGAGVYEGDLANSAGLAAALSNETGTGLSVFSTSPTITTPDILGMTWGTDKFVVCNTFTSAGINAAIDTLSTEGGEVYLPEGDYDCTASITIDYNNTTLRGAGKGTRLLATNRFIFDAATEFNGIVAGETITGTTGGRTYTAIVEKITYDTASAGTVWYHTLSNVANYQDNDVIGHGAHTVTIAGTPTEQSFNAIDTNGKYYCTITDLCVVGGSGGGNNTSLIGSNDDADYLTIKNCFIYRGDWRDINSAGEFVEVNGCYVEGADDHSIMINGDNCIVINNKIGVTNIGIGVLGKYAVVNNNTINGGSYGVRLFGGQNCSIVGNIFITCTQNSIYLLNTSSNNSIIGNSILTNSKHAILIESGLYNIISNNTIDDTNTGYADIAILTDYNTISNNNCFGDTTSNVGILLDEADYCTVTGNFTTGHDVAGIQEDSDCQNNLIYGNNCQDSTPYILNGTTPENLRLTGDLIADVTGALTGNADTATTAANLSGTPALPNGTTATTQAAADNSTKLATTAYADAAAGGGGAATSLNNLASVAINTSLVSDTADTDDLGSTTKEWANVYVGDVGKIYLGIGQDASINRSAANEMTLVATSGVTVESVKMDGGVVTGATLAAANNVIEADTVTNATLTTALTVNTGTLTLTANVANNSVLTVGAGASSVSGSNTGDNTVATSGDSATDFFSSGEIADAQISDTLTASLSTTAAADDNDTSIATTAFVQQEIKNNNTQSKSFVILNPVATDDYPIWKAPVAITITAVHVQCLGGTNIVGQLTECDAEGINAAVVDSADITATADNSVDDDGTLSNPSIDALDYVGWATTSISGTPTSVTVTFDYIINQVN